MRTLLAFFITTLLAISGAYAEVVSLHQNPDANSPSIGVIDLGAGMVPVYTPKGSDWIKVADPTNGNVGWIKQSDIKNLNSASIVVNQQVVSPTGKVENKGFSLKVGQPIDVNDPKVKAKLDEMRKLQENVQNNMKIQIQDMVKGINDLYQKQLQLLQDSGFYVPAKPIAPPLSNNAKPILRVSP